MSEKNLDIQPAQVPLSHLQAPVGQGSAAAQPRQSYWGAPLLLTVLVLGAAAVVWWLNGLGERAAQSAGSAVVITAEPGQPDAPASIGKATRDALPPFAQTQRALARDRAQDALAQFVEQQIALEDSMAVAAWGQAALDAALASAAAGDEAFVDEQFEAAQAAYEFATAALSELIAEGEARVEAALAAGQEALAARDDEAANEAFQTALLIAPQNAAAQAGLDRAAKQPEVRMLLLKARNEELAGNWNAAVATYQSLEALDPETEGIRDLQAAAAAAVADADLRKTLSEGFTALEARRFGSARRAFRQALEMSPGNEIALGGLQQVSARTELSQIGRLEQQASEAVIAEDWPRAVKAYEEALAIDSNIQFAKAGLGQARAQATAAATLRQIIEAPNKLSSPELMQAGREAIARAEGLNPKGPKLQALVARSAALLDAYAQPVAVRLTSDNATEVLVSTVGRLGTFSERQLSLRPGEYTLLGSRSGCRDIRRTVLVEPEMAPIDIRCEERLRR